MHEFSPQNLDQNLPIELVGGDKFELTSKIDFPGINVAILIGSNIKGDTIAVTLKLVEGQVSIEEIKYQPVEDKNGSDVPGSLVMGKVKISKGNSLSSESTRLIKRTFGQPAKAA